MKVLVAIYIPEIGIQMLQDAGLKVTVWRGDLPMDPDQFWEACLEHNVVIAASPYVLDRKFLMGHTNLNMISQYAAGFDNIDVATATELGIQVCNTPNAMNHATADIAFALMHCVARNLFQEHMRIRAGGWGQFQPRKYLGVELRNKTLGIFGLGRIGLEMARRCQAAYHMPIIYHNRSRNTLAEQELNATYVSWEQLLETSDVISVHSVLDSTTRLKFDADAFQSMKSSAIFINTARGGIHDEKALQRAIEMGEIWGAGLDVTDPEPMDSGNPLLRMDRVAILPHIGSATVEARDEMARMAAQNVIDFVSGRPLENQVNHVPR